jgi:hypothetical protein
MIKTNLGSKFVRVVMLSMLASLGGCEAAGILASDATGEPTVKAKYVPDKQASMLVLVESYGLAVDSEIESQHIALTLGRALTDEKVASIVDPQVLEKLRDSDPEKYNQMTIAEIGRKVGARQILYVDIQRDEVVKPPASGQMRGHIEAVIKVVDSATGNTRWPLDESSERVQYTSDWTPESASSTESDLRAKMADQMADDISKLFHDYQVDQPLPDADDNKVNVN